MSIPMSIPRIPTTTLFIIALLCTLSACESPNDLPEHRKQAFDRNKVTITADADSLITDRPITITTSCLPLVDGIGRIKLLAGTNDSGSPIIVLSPVSDTLWKTTADSLMYTVVPARFIANKPFEQRWTVQLRAVNQSSQVWFDVRVELDSVFVADSMKMLPVQSEAAIRQSGELHGYTITAVGSILMLQR